MSEQQPSAAQGLEPWERLVLHAVPLFLVLVATALAYAGTLRAGFVFDDLELITTNKDFLEGKTIGEYAKKYQFRRELLRSYKRDLNLSGGKEPDPRVFHLMNVGTHLAVVALLYALLLFLGYRLGFSLEERLSFSILAAGLFSFHPVQSEAVAYVAGRSDLLSTFYLLLALAFFFVPLLSRPAGEEISGQEEENALPSTTYWALCLGSWALCLAAFGKGLLCKEAAAVLPALAALAAWLVPQKNSPWTGRTIAFLGVLFAGTLAALVFRAVAFGMVGDPDAKRPLFVTLATNLWAVVRYIGLFFWPYPQNADYDFPFVRRIFDWRVGVGFLVIGAVLSAAWALRRRAPEMALGLLWFLVGLSPTTSFVALNDVFVERRLYLPSIGLCLVLAGGLVRLRRTAVERDRLEWLPRARWAGAALAAALLLLTALRTRVWADEVNLWADVVKKSPNKERGFYNLGTAILKHGRAEDAIGVFGQVFRIDKYDIRAHLNVAAAFLQAGWYDQAHWIYKNNVLGIDPNNAEARYNLAVIHEKKGEESRALEYLEEAVRLKPDMVPALVKLGTFAFDRDEPRVAEDYFKKALEADPKDPVANRYMALLYSEILVDPVKARKHFEVLTQVEPGDAQNWFNLGVLEDREGHFEKARDFYNKAIHLGPGHAGAYLNLAALLERRGYRSEACRLLDVGAAKVPELVPHARRACAGGAGVP